MYRTILSLELPYKISDPKQVLEVRWNWYRTWSSIACRSSDSKLVVSIKINPSAFSSTFNTPILGIPIQKHIHGDHR